MQEGVRMLLGNYGNMQTLWVKQQHSFPACLRVSLALPHPTSFSCFPSLARLSPPSLLQVLHCLYQTFPLCCPQIPGRFGDHLETVAVWWPHRHGSQLGWPFIRRGERASSGPLGNFPVPGSRLAVRSPPLIEFFGLRTSSVLLAFLSHAEC